MCVQKETQWLSTQGGDPVKLCCEELERLAVLVGDSLRKEG